MCLNLRLEYRDRILLLATAIMIFWLAAIDVVVLMFFKVGIINSFRQEVDLYVDLYSKGDIKTLPNYIKITPKLINDKDFTLYKIKGDKYIYINLHSIIELLKRFIWTILAWELALTLTVVLFVSVIVKRFVDKEKSTNEMLKFVLMSISHKLGNFLSAQRVNLELLGNSEVKFRIDRAINEIENDFNFLSSCIKRLADERREINRVDICKEIKGIFGSFSFGDRKVAFNVPNECKTRIDLKDFRMVFSEIASNAFKYSKSYIEVSIKRKKRNKFKVSIVNDINFEPSKSGIGMTIVEYISRRNGWVFAKKVEEDVFMIIFLI